MSSPPPTKLSHHPATRQRRKWHAVIGDPTYADAILDHLVHNAHRFDLAGDKCLNREEFVVVGWTDPEGARPRLGALLIGYYDPNGWLVYTGRVGSGIDHGELERLWRRLQPLAMADMPLEVPPPRNARFGSPLVLSWVHWARPELGVEVKFLAWTEDNLLRQVVHEGLREDKPAAEVRRPRPHPKSTGSTRKSPRTSSHPRSSFYPSCSLSGGSISSLIAQKDGAAYRPVLRPGSDVTGKSGARRALPP